MKNVKIEFQIKEGEDEGVDARNMVGALVQAQKKIFQNYDGKAAHTVLRTEKGQPFGYVEIKNC